MKEGKKKGRRENQVFMLKVDLHIHTKGDPIDNCLQYTPQDIVRIAAKQKFDALAFTWHNKVFDTGQLKQYAKKKGITLIQGTELTIQGKHTLLYNITKEEVSKIKTLDDVYQFKDHVLVGAPHPFFPLPSCLGKKVFEHKKLFNFIEHSNFYTRSINFNKKALLAAQQLHLPLLGNSDVHLLSTFGKDYSMIDAAPNVDSILDVLKKKAVGENKKKIEIETKPYPLGEFLSYALYFAPRGINYFLFRRLREKEYFY